MAGANFSLSPGELVEVNEEVATSWVENGIAKPFVPPEVKVIQHNPEVPEPTNEDPGTADSDNEDSAPIDLTKPTDNLELKVEDQGQAPVNELKHVGGGWYLLPNGEKVHGKEAAEGELKKLQGSDE
jgi:hypothetical protein